jgi:hypothetical protein
MTASVGVPKKANDEACGKNAAIRKVKKKDVIQKVVSLKNHIL